MIYVLVTITTLPGRAAELIKAARACIDATRREDGCLSYDYLQDTEREDTVHVVERWSTREALAAHFLTEHLVAWRELRKPLVRSSSVEIVHSDHVETI